MQCDNIKKQLSPYLDGELDERQDKVIKQHLQTCSSCRKEFEAIKNASNTLALLDPVIPPEDLWQQLSAKIPQIGATSDPHKIAARKPFFAGLRHRQFAWGAAALVIVFTVFVYWKSWQPENTPAQQINVPYYALDLSFILDSLTTGASLKAFQHQYSVREASWEKAAETANFKVIRFPSRVEPFQLKKVYLLKNLCCNIVQVTYTDGSNEIFLFQQPPGHPVYFGRGEVKKVALAGISSLLTEKEGCIAVNWESEKGNFTLVGNMHERDIEKIIKSVGF